MIKYILPVLLCTGAAVAMEKTHNMQQVMYYISKEKGVQPQKFYPLVDRKQLPDCYVTEEEALKQGYLVGSNNPFNSEELCKETSTSIWSSLVSLVYSKQNVEQDPRDWKNPLIVNRGDFLGWQPQGNFVLCWGKNKCQVFDVKRGKKAVDYEGEYSSSFFNADCTHMVIITAHENGKAFIYDIINGGRPVELAFEKSARFVQPNPTSNHFVVVNNKNIVVYDLKNGNPRELDVQSSIKEYYWAGEDTSQNRVPVSFVVKCENGKVLHVNPRDNYKITEISYKNSFDIFGVIMSAASKMFAITDGYIKMYDAVTGKEEYAGIIHQGDKLDGILITWMDGKVFSVSTNTDTRRGILLYDVQNPKPVFCETNKNEFFPIFGIMNSNGAYMACHTRHDKKFTEYFFDATNGKLLDKIVSRLTGGYYAWAPHTSSRISIVPDSAFIYNAKKERCEFVQHDDVRAFFKSNESFVFALRKKTSPKEGKFYLFNGDETSVIPFITHEPFTLSNSEFNANGKLLVLPGVTQGYVYDVASGRCLKTLDLRRDDTFKNFGFSRNDEYLVASGSRYIDVYSPKDDYKLLHTLKFEEENEARFMMPDKAFFYVSGNQSLTLYYMHNGQLIELKN